jgi:hypothetical protein
MLTFLLLAVCLQKVTQKFSLDFAKFVNFLGLALFANLHADGQCLPCFLPPRMHQWRRRQASPDSTHADGAAVSPHRQERIALLTEVEAREGVIHGRQRWRPS